MPRDFADKIIMFSVIGLVAWAIIGLPAIQWLQQPVPNKHAQPAPSKQQRGPQQPRADAQAHPVGQSQAEKNQSGADHHGGWYSIFIDHPAEWVIAAFTIMLAFYTRGLYRATKGLQDATTGMLAFAGEQARDMKDAIKTSQEAAKAAAKSAEVSERALIAADRAWLTISIDPLTRLTFGPDNIEIEVRMVIKNVGKSPATNLTFNLDMDADSAIASTKAAEAVGKLRDIRPALLGYGHVLFPGEEFPFDKILSIPREDFLRRINEVDSTEVEGITEPYTRSNPAIVGRAYYSLPNAGLMGTYKFTTTIFEVCSNEPRHLGFDGSESGQFSIELVRSPMGGKTT